MRMILKSLAAGAVILTATQADAGQFLAPGPNGLHYGLPHGRGYVPLGYRRGYIAPRYYAPPPQHRPDLGAAIAGALAGAALQLIPRAAEALAARLPPHSAPQPPTNDVLADIEGNPRGITRQEVEAALLDWCASHGDAPLCQKLQVR